MSAMEELALEYRLTVGVRRNCECAGYFIGRRDVLLPEVLKEAKRRSDVAGRYLDPVDLFADYARKVHVRHLSGLSLAVTA